MKSLPNQVVITAWAIISALPVLKKLTKMFYAASAV